MQTTICEKCGKEYGIGASPFCRDNHEGGGHYGYEAFTPYTDTQIARYGKHFGNRGERISYMNKNNIEYKDLSQHKGVGKRLFLDMKGK